MVKTEEIIITCSDNVRLAGTCFLPQNYKGAVMIGGATGVKSQFYQAFAIFLAENNYGVITFDFRGIGGSLIGHTKDSDASLVMWGALDMPAVLNTLKSKFPNTKYHLVGHSAGGQLVGLMNNAQELSSMFNFACSSGSISNMKYPFKIKGIFFLNIFIPLNNLFWGYTNAQWLDMGEPLPKMVAKQWHEWCDGKGYVKMAFGKSVKKHYYNDLTFPSFWLNATDDPIANNENVADMISVFPNIKATTKTLEPNKIGISTIGHMKFFSRKNQTLWKFTIDWLNNN